MPPRKAAVAAAKALAAPSEDEFESEDEVNSSEQDELDSDLDSDGDEGEDVDVEGDDNEDDDEDDEVPVAKSKAQESKQKASTSRQKPSSSSTPSTKTPESGSSRPGIKVKLKLGRSQLHKSTLPQSSNASDDSEPMPGPSRRVGPVKRAIVSGDEEDEDELEDAQSVQSTARMTARQAAIATGLEQEHIELPISSAPKKKVLTQAEIAARRTESARKRKNLTAKRLEDDKIDTINRLLKKQSAGTRRKKALEEKASATLANGASTPSHAGAVFSKFTGRPPVPTFRWISTSRSPVVEVVDENTTEQPSTDPRVSFSFSVPWDFLPPGSRPPPPPEPSSSSGTPEFTEAMDSPAGTRSPSQGSAMEIESTA